MESLSGFVSMVEHPMGSSLNIKARDESKALDGTRLCPLSFTSSMWRVLASNSKNRSCCLQEHGFGNVVIKWAEHFSECEKGRRNSVVKSSYCLCRGPVQFSAPTSDTPTTAWNTSLRESYALSLVYAEILKYTQYNKNESLKRRWATSKFKGSMHSLVACASLMQLLLLWALVIPEAQHRRTSLLSPNVSSQLLLMPLEVAGTQAVPERSL